MFIVFEGIDGSGKSTLSKAYVEALKAEGVDALWTCEPTHEGLYGAQIRKMLTGETPMIEPEPLALLFALDRLDHLARVITPASAQRTVVCDRYVLSNIAYQGAARGGDEKFVDWVASVNGYAPHPDLSVYLKVRPEVARARIEARGNAEVFDGPERYAFRDRVVEIYERYHHDVVIDTSDITKEQALERLLTETLFRRGRLALTGGPRHAQ